MLYIEIRVERNAVLTHIRLDKRIQPDFAFHRVVDSVQIHTCRPTLSNYILRIFWIFGFPLVIRLFSLSYVDICSRSVSALLRITGMFILEF